MGGWDVRKDPLDVLGDVRVEDGAVGVGLGPLHELPGWVGGWVGG